MGAFVKVGPLICSVMAYTVIVGLIMRIKVFDYVEISK